MTLDYNNFRTQKDKTLRMDIKFIQDGWPSEPSKLPPNVCLYFTYCEDLCYINRLVLKGDQIVIPKTLQNEMKTLFYNGHFGIVKIKNCAGEIMFWAEMNNDIENIVRTCDVSQQYHK